MSEVTYLLEQAARCRRLARGIDDARTVEALLRMAEDFQRRAAEIAEPSNEIPPPIST